MIRSVKWIIIAGAVLLCGLLFFFLYNPSAILSCTHPDHTLVVTGVPGTSALYSLENGAEALDIEGCLTGVSEKDGKVILSVAFFDKMLRAHTYQFVVAYNSEFMVWTGNEQIAVSGNDAISVKIKTQGNYIRLFSVVYDPNLIYSTLSPEERRAYMDKFINALKTKSGYPKPNYGIPVIGVGF
jgi:hypothetical protein